MIKEVMAREILDSRGVPTVEAEVRTNKGIFRASVPSGASTGEYESVELRDNDKLRYFGKGVLKAVKNITDVIACELKNKNPSNQKKIDNLLIELDGTKNKSGLGANSILAVSMAVARAGSAERKFQLYKYIQKISGNEKLNIPKPCFNIINGGRHAGNLLSFQEFMVIPHTNSFRRNLQIGSEIYHRLKSIIEEHYSLSATNLGDEGGFAPNIQSIEDALGLIQLAISKSGYKDKTGIAIDVAASEFFDLDSKKYDLNFKSEKKQLMSPEQLLEYYKKLTKKYNITSIEDPFDEDDWISFTKISKSLRGMRIVGDDILVTNPQRIRKAIARKSCNTLLLKLNQIGTLSEAIESANLAKQAGWKIMVSHRSGETEDSFISDLAVGVGADYIKAGAPARGERTAKYNQLLRIEEEIQKSRKV